MLAVPIRAECLVPKVRKYKTRFDAMVNELAAAYSDEKRTQLQ